MFKNFILDVDGVLTTGHMIYSQDGKKYKIFGPHDNDGLKMIKDLINIQFISADRNGYSITQKRILDMGFSVDLVSENDRNLTLMILYWVKLYLWVMDSTMQR